MGHKIEISNVNITLRLWRRIAESFDCLSRADRGIQTKIRVGSSKKKIVIESVTLEGILSFALKKLYIEKIKDEVFCTALTSIT